MLARDIMTSNVISVSPETPVREIVLTLLRHNVSAVPVIDQDGRPVGIVSDGDLVASGVGILDDKRDRWLSQLGEGEHLSDEYIAYVRGDSRAAHQIMATPVITVAEDTEVTEIARLLTSYHIKRVPVLRHRRIVGIVSRTDLVRAMTGEPAAARPQPPMPAPAEPLPPASAPSADAGEAGLSAAHFRGLVIDHEEAETRRHEADRRAAAERRHKEVSSLIVRHVEDQEWQAILHEAQEAAVNGGKDFLLLRFPSQLCSDGGRAVNAPESDWPATLRGEAAELYIRWERHLKNRGFGLAAKVLDFPGGMPGDIGLYLTWGI